LRKARLKLNIKNGWSQLSSQAKKSIRLEKKLSPAIVFYINLTIFVSSART